MLAYKKLIPKPSRNGSITWISPVRRTRWVRNEMHATSNDGVYACLAPDDPQLSSYSGVLVEIEVWGQVDVGENGVLKAEHARVVQPLTTPTELLEAMLASMSRLPKWFTRTHALMSPKCALYYALSNNHNTTTDPDIRARILESPACAVELARNEGPRDDTRTAACRDLEAAYDYAQLIDDSPRDETRNAVLYADGVEKRRARLAYAYAVYLDKQPRDDTRSAACQSPEPALDYALHVDHGPHDDTRRAACENAETAFRYARHVDKAPRDDTRAAACRDPYYATEYAALVDKTPRDDTRRAACCSPLAAYNYILYVDHERRDDTWAAVSARPSLIARLNKYLKGGRQ